MQNWRSPWWILLSGVFPIGIFLVLASQIFYIISPQLTADSKTLWYLLGGSLTVLGLGQLGYYFFLHFKGEKSNLIYHVLVYVLYFAWLYSCMNSFEKLIPADIPRWMVNNDVFLYPVGFIMPNLAYALYSIIASLTNFEKNPKPWENFFGAVAITLFCYLFLNIFAATGPPPGYLMHLFIVGLLSLSTLFFFFLGRSFYIFAHRPWGNWSKWQLLIKGIIGIVFPVWGLIINNGSIRFLPEYIFGNFSSPWFYGLAIFNGILLTLPTYPNPVYRVVLFVLRSFCFTYILYFALVFMPFLPLAIPAILAFGTGFLMLTPLVLLIMQSIFWVKDLEYLATFIPKPRILLSGLLAALILPAYLYFNAVQDRKAFHAALDYVYAPDLSKKENLKLSDARLNRVFAAIKTNKGRNNWEPGQDGTPYLSHFYNSIVLDNLTITDLKLNKLEAILLGKELRYGPDYIQTSSVPKIKQNSVDSKWNELDQSWTSTIQLEIENASENLEEYSTTFALPDGALIQDYYLYIGEEKVKGQLAERKTATWIYQQIRYNSRRDPGLLSYLNDQTLSLRVFPFLAKETRKTGFTIVHKEAFELQLDTEHKLTLGDLSRNQSLDSPLILGNGKVAYISTALRAALPQVILQPHYHFIVDCSALSKDSDHVENIKAFIREHKLPEGAYSFHLTNREVETLDAGQNWPEAILNHPRIGGFFAERAIDKILYSYTQKPVQRYPVMVLVSSFPPILPETAPALANSVYNGMHYYRLEKQGLEAFQFLQEDKIEIAFPAPVEAAVYPNSEKPLAYLTKSSLIRLPGYQSSSELKKGTWESAALLQADWRYLEGHPELGEASWLKLVKKSFDTGFLTPETAYIVLENESQRRLLKVKQQQVLQGKKALDVGEDPQKMSEPGFWVLLSLLLLLLWWKRFKS